MSINLRIALVIITIIYLALILKSIKNKKIQVSFLTFWIVSGILLIISVITPNLVEFITYKLGFEVPANMLFCITIFIAFYLIFNLTIKVSRVYSNNVSLVQEVSILKKRLEKLENNEEKTEK